MPRSLFTYSILTLNVSVVFIHTHTGADGGVLFHDALHYRGIGTDVVVISFSHVQFYFTISSILFSFYML